MRNSIHMQRVFSLSDVLFSVLNGETRSYIMRFPRDLERIIVCGLEVPVIRKEALTLRSAHQYLCALRGSGKGFSKEYRDRSLYGLLHIGPPCSMIFIREDLPPHIKNYVLAHELGHFLADVFLLQQLWIKTLPEQKEAIQRAFTWDKYDGELELRGLLKGLPERPRPIVGRGNARTPETADREILADLFAREIIAPWDEISQRFQQNERRDFISTVHRDFGLPLKIAAYYFDDIQRILAPKPDLLDCLFSPLHGPAS